MKFFMKMIPSTVTHQEKKVAVRNGKPILYEPPRLKDAREKLMAGLAQCRPGDPYQGPVILRVMWLFPKGRHRDGDWKTTKPDTDNLQKLLKDCMTACCFWKDDAQVCVEHIEKRWSSRSGIYVEVEELEGKS